MRGGGKGEHKISDQGACASPPWEKSGVQWARAGPYEFFGGSMVKIRSILTTFMRGRKSIIFCRKWIENRTIFYRKWGRKSNDFLPKMGPKICSFSAEIGAENRTIFVENLFKFCDPPRGGPVINFRPPCALRIRDRLRTARKFTSVINLRGG